MITLITSLYKSEPYLKDFVRNVLKFNEDFEKSNIHLECILVLNDPSETELTLLTPLSEKSWITSLIVPREPIYASWNRGIQHASSDIAGFWNVDDIRFSEAVKEGLTHFTKGAKLVYFPFIYKRYVKLFSLPILVRQRRVIPPEFNKKEFSESMHLGPFFLFKKSFYNIVGPFDEQFRIAGDFEWAIRAAAKNKLVRVNSLAGIFRNEGTSLSGSKDSRHEIENEIVYHRHGINHKMKQIKENSLNEYDSKNIKYTKK